MAELCPVCCSGKLLLHGDDLVCHNPGCQNVMQRIETHHLHPKEKCAYCGSGKAILSDHGEFVCNNCGVVLPLVESISGAESDVPEKWTKVPDDRHKHIQEVQIGNRTAAYIIKTEQEQKKERKQRQQQIEKKSLNDEIKRRNEQQKIMIESAICDMTEALDLKPGKVLARFQSRLKELGMNLIVNRGLLREPNCVAAGLIYKVHRNHVTMRRLKKLSGCGGKSLQKILRLL